MCVTKYFVFELTLPRLSYMHAGCHYTGMGTVDISMDFTFTNHILQIANGESFHGLIGNCEIFPVI